VRESILYWNGLPVVIFGSGGISRETLHIIEETNSFNKVKVFDFLGFVESEENKMGQEVTKGYKIISCDNSFLELAKMYKILGVVIPLGTPKIKKVIYEKLKKIENVVFPNIIHPNVTLDKQTVNLGIGNIIASGTRLTNDIVIGNFNLINLNCTVGHDTNIGNYNVINPLASISGSVEIGECCLIGTGANILQQLNIQDYSTIGAGSVVTKDVMLNETVVGIPAKRLEKRLNV
jgi:sugar O-acyltransferase (sialic acid O-acetyltransferase NeuD family)